MTATRQKPPAPAVALEHMTGLARGSAIWLTGATLDVTLDAGCLIQISETESDTAAPDLMARLHRLDNTYEIETIPGKSVWVNGRQVSRHRLDHGDSVEFGETGPLCRVRFYSDSTWRRKPVGDIFSDTATYLRVSRQRPLKRVLRAGGALIGRLTLETTILFRLTVLAALAVFALLAWQQHQLNQLLRRGITDATAQLDSVGAALATAQKDALRPADLTALRDSLEQRVTSNLSRLEYLEQRTTATARVIAQSHRAVAFLQGAYGFRERDGGRMLRQVVDDRGQPLMTPRGRPLLSLDGDGPVVELQFTGTGFLVGEDGILMTNRHVAEPWQQNSAAQGLEGVEPVMIRFIAYLPGRADPIPVTLRAASEIADLAVLSLSQDADAGGGLRLAATQPASGDEVIVMGYPTGLRSMLAQSGAGFVKQLQADGVTDFWSVAARLAGAGYIAPLASRGIVGQVTPATIVYDAETTHGGSGGPVLDIHGDVVAVNTAILPEFGGSNLGVPVAQARALIEIAAGE